MTKEKLEELIEFYEDVLKSTRSHLNDGKTIMDGDTQDVFNEFIRVIDEKRLDAFIEFNAVHFGLRRDEDGNLYG